MAANPEPLSRQRLWQLKQVQEGKCQTCARPLNLHTVRCDECAEKANAIKRRSTGYQPWHPGGRGRIPDRMKRGSFPPVS